MTVQDVQKMFFLHFIRLSLQSFIFDLTTVMLSDYLLTEGRI